MANELTAYYLQAMGLTPWVLRESAPSVQQSLNKLEQEVAQCKRCSLSIGRTQTVFFRGNPSAKLFIIGEAPGYYEDKQGKPFVGKAGQLLDKMLRTIGLDEEKIYIANVLKCRPPDNRDPSPEEINQCSPFLDKQIECLKPTLILGLGRFASQYLLKKSVSLSQARQNIHYFKKIPFLLTYHPAYLLRNPIDKKKAFADLLWVKRLLSQ